MGEPVTGMAAGVPFTALPPAAGEGRAPLVVTWHMMDAPRSDAAFAAALPMAGVPAWRVHLGMPMSGARMVDGSMDAVVALAMKDSLMAYLAPFVRQAVAEFPAALAALREQLPVDDGPIAVVGGSLGGAVVLNVLAESDVQIKAVALVNPATRVGAVVSLFEAGTGQAYPWNAQSREVAAQLDFVARASEVAGREAPLLLVSGELDHDVLRADGASLVNALRQHYGKPDNVQLLTVPDLAHPLADEPGIEPAPQGPTAKVVDDAITQWLRTHFTD